jgi:hypothetical protein
MATGVQDCLPTSKTTWVSYDRHARGIDCAAGESVLQRPVDSCDVRTVAPAAILLEPAVLYTPSTAMYNAVMYTRMSSLARRDS